MDVAAAILIACSVLVLVLPTSLVPVGERVRWALLLLALGILAQWTSVSEHTLNL